MENLLEETIKVIAENGKKTEDVKWVGVNEKWCRWDDFAKVSDFEYYERRQDINRGLLVVGSDWWLERCEYEDYEWWEFKEKPRKPSLHTPLTRDDLKGE